MTLKFSTDYRNNLQNLRGNRAACPVCAKQKERRRDNALALFADGGCYCHRCQATRTDVVRVLGVGDDHPSFDDRHQVFDRQIPLDRQEVRPKPASQPTEWNHRRDRHAIAFFEFETVEGVRVQHVKFPKSDKYPRYSWRHMVNGAWHNGIGGNTCYLFNRKRLESAEIVYLVEGEKDAGRGESEMRAAGRQVRPIAFTTSHAGASASLKPHQLAQLDGKTVYLIGDRDDAGRLGVYKKFVQLAEAGIECHLVTLPIDEAGGDLSDYFDNGATFADLLRESALEPHNPIELLQIKSAHTCGAFTDGFTAIVSPTVTKITKWKPQKWRICPACYEARVQRLINQVKAWREDDAHLWHSCWNAAEWKRKRDAWRKREQRGGATISYISFPQDDGSIVVIHNVERDGDELLPTNLPMLKTLITVWAMAPEGKCIGNSRNGVGGEYRGTRGDQSSEARERREAERDKLHEIARRTLDGFTPDPTQRGMAGKSADSIKALLPLATDEEAKSWLYYEFYIGKQRKTVLTKILNRLGAIKASDGLSVQFLGRGREKIAEAMGCNLNHDGAGEVEISPLAAFTAIKDNALEYSIVGGGDALGAILQMSAFLKRNSDDGNQAKEVCKKADILSQDEPFQGDLLTIVSPLIDDQSHSEPIEAYCAALYIDEIADEIPF